MTLTWLCLAAGLLLAGGAPSAPESRAAPGAPESRAAPRRLPSMRTLQWLGGGAIAAVCVLTLGAGRGTVIALLGAPLTVVVIARLHAQPHHARASPSLALALDLVAVALRAGQPLAAALVLAAPAAGGATGEELTRIGGLLRLGADPAQAWRAAADDSVLAPVAVAARRSAASGTRLAGAFEQLAGELRAQLRAAATARAERAGVFAAAPLGLCFLPSFVCLGIVPIVIGVAGAALGGGT